MNTLTLYALIKNYIDNIISNSGQGELNKKIEELENSLNLILNGAGTEEIDSILELIEYTKEHGLEVTQMQNDIDNLKQPKNKISILDNNNNLSYLFINEEGNLCLEVNEE